MISLNLFAQRDLLHAHAQLFNRRGNRCLSVCQLDPPSRLRWWTVSISRAYHVFPSLLLREFCMLPACFDLLAEVCFQQIEYLRVIHGFCQIVAAPARVSFL